MQQLEQALHPVAALLYDGDEGEDRRRFARSELDEGRHLLVQNVDGRGFPLENRVLEQHRRRRYHRDVPLRQQFGRGALQRQILTPAARLTLQFEPKSA